MLDEDLQVELFHLEIEIHEAALRDDVQYAAELRTQWFERSLSSYSEPELISLLAIHMRKWKQAGTEAIPEAIRIYTDRVIMIMDRLGY